MWNPMSYLRARLAKCSRAWSLPTRRRQHRTALRWRLLGGKPSRLMHLDPGTPGPVSKSPWSAKDARETQTFFEIAMRPPGSR